LVCFARPKPKRKGEGGNPSPGTLQKITKALGVGVDDLLKG
jgi:transcriptional regulator with XRE-family HTH domain